ncbi:MAG TPA: hypothetical protein VK668_13995 [Mucilaginibacter sp.]|nr:hypothetical protein [Mucilaginibacter sp.]
MKIIRICLMYLFLVVYSGCDNHKQMENSVRKLLYEQHFENKDTALYHQFLNYGKNVIPYLIDNVDNKRKEYGGNFNPLNSNLYQIANFDGVHAAYVVELILSNSANAKARYVLFNRDIIVKDAGYLPLEYNDMIEIKRLYNNWWILNKEKPIDKLREDWRNKKRPLSGSHYNWF